MSGWAAAHGEHRRAATEAPCRPDGQGVDPLGRENA